MVKKIIVVTLFLTQGLYLFATAQEPDRIIFKGINYPLIVNPMEPYFEKFPDKRPRFDMTSLWRGYVATFEIIENELWVTEIKKSNKASIIKEVLDGKNKMKIDWFSGLLVIPQGKIIDYVHMGYSSTYEHYIVLEIRNGNFIKELKMDNRQFDEFREKQFELYKKTDKYRKLVEKLKEREGESEEKMEYFLKIFIVDYIEKIYE